MRIVNNPMALKGAARRLSQLVEDNQGRYAASAFALAGATDAERETLRKRLVEWTSDDTPLSEAMRHLGAPPDVVSALSLALGVDNVIVARKVYCGEERAIQLVLAVIGQRPARNGSGPIVVRNVCQDAPVSWEPDGKTVKP